MPQQHPFRCHRRRGGGVIVLRFFGLYLFLICLFWGDLNHSNRPVCAASATTTTTTTTTTKSQVHTSAASSDNQAHHEAVPGQTQQTAPQQEHEQQQEQGTCDATTTGARDKYGLTASNITNCLATEQNPNRPTYNAQTFVQIRNVYRQVQAQYPHDIRRIVSEQVADQAGIVVPFQVSTIPGTSYRGVFAVENVIPRGAVVWSPHYAGVFGTEEAWLAFLYALLREYGDGEYDLGKHLACDVLQWSYVMGEPEEGYDVVLDLDEGSFVNHGWTAKGEANIADIDQLYDDDDDDITYEAYLDCPTCMRASREIQVGEQIRTDYTTFYQFGALEWYEASVAKAWNVDRSTRYIDEASGDIHVHGEPQWHYR
ncbi:hypothetical protein ACA910_019846 [Epithemia clementina (nom. ined.)]